MIRFGFQVRAFALVIGVTGLILAGCSQNRSSSVQPSSSASVSVPASSSAAPGSLPSSPTGSSNTIAPNGGVQPTATLGVEPTPTATLNAQDQKIVDTNVQAVAKNGAIAKQDTGKTYLSNLLVRQQTEHLVKRRFNDDLKRLASDIPADDEDYRIEIRQADTTQTVMVATAKQKGFSSYTGVVYAIEGQIPIAGICKTNVPSATPPQAPKLVQSAIICPEGSSQIN